MQVADPIRIQGFWWPKIEKKKNYSKKTFKFFWIKTTIYLSLGIHIWRPRYKRSLQLSKEDIHHFKTWIFLVFLYFYGPFLPNCIRIQIPNTDPDPLTRLNPIRIQFGSGSATLKLWELKAQHLVSKSYLVLEIKVTHITLRALNTLSLIILIPGSDTEWIQVAAVAVFHRLSILHIDTFINIRQHSSPAHELFVGFFAPFSYLKKKHFHLKGLWLMHTYRTQGMKPLIN